MDKEKLIRKFDNQSKIYEVRRKKQSERKWWEKLIGSAKGKVLEVAVGAGAKVLAGRSNFVNGAWPQFKPIDRQRTKDYKAGIPTHCRLPFGS